MGLFTSTIAKVFCQFLLGILFGLALSLAKEDVGHHCRCSLVVVQGGQAVVNSLNLERKSIMQLDLH